MPAHVQSEQRSEIAVIMIEHPPVNTLAEPVRAALLESLRAARARGITDWQARRAATREAVA